MIFEESVGWTDTVVAAERVFIDFNCLAAFMVGRTAAAVHRVNTD